MAIPRKSVQTVRQFAREHALFRPGPLLVAVSGGTDSTALLLVLAELADDLGLVLHAAHFDHRARPRAAALDAQYVADVAARCGAQLRIGRAETKPASEDAARTARYAFLRRVGAELGATAIATGHTRDDQAETVILHAARGSGLAGLAAMRASRDGIVRPLLCLGREDTVAICTGARVVPREDPTNRSLRFARNRVRHKVLPELAKLNPRVSEALARLATSAALTLDALRAMAERALESSLDADTIDLARLGDDANVRDEALALAWERATGRALAARARAALAAEASRRDGSASLDLPGGRAVREYARLRIEPERARGEVPQPGSDEQALVPERPLEWGGWTLLLSRRADAGGWTALAVAPEPHLGVVVRARRPGDRMAGENRAKLQDVLTDAKVPAQRRSAHPIVVTASGEVWWVPGITSRTQIGEWRIFARRSGSDGVASSG